MPTSSTTSITATALQPVARSFAASTPESATTEPTERSMPPVMITNVMPTASTMQVGVVDEQVEQHLEREEAVVARRPDPEHGDEQHERGQHGQHARRGEAPPRGGSGALPRRRGGAGGVGAHDAATASRTGAGRVRRSSARVFGDCSRQTAMMTSALNTSVTSGGMPAV